MSSGLSWKVSIRMGGQYITTYFYSTEAYARDRADDFARMGCDVEVVEPELVE